jgi:hypothetical protein
VFHAGAGDDRIVLLDDGTPLKVDGGAGTDTLAFDSGGIDLDLTSVPDSLIQGIENIDLGDHGNSLELNVRDLLNLSDTGNQLVVDGGASDSVTVGGGWDDGGDFGGYHHYSSGAATLLINDAITSYSISV